MFRVALQVVWSSFIEIHGGYNKSRRLVVGHGPMSDWMPTSCFFGLFPAFECKIPNVLSGSSFALAHLGFELHYSCPASMLFDENILPYPVPDRSTTDGNGMLHAPDMQTALMKPDTESCWRRLTIFASTKPCG